MFCSKCGAVIADTSATFCPQCGASTQSAPQPVAPPPPASAAAAGLAPAPYLGSNLPGANISAAQPYLAPPQTDGQAIVSLILGICSWIGLWVLAGIPAIILGHLAKSSIRKSNGRLKGDGMATAGLVLGYLSVGMLPLILIIAAIAIPSLLRAKMSANGSAAVSAVRMLNTAEISYATAYPDAGSAKSLFVLGPGQPAVDCTNLSNATAEHACLIEGILGCGSSRWCYKSGYRFNVTGICDADRPCAGYVITATPMTASTWDGELLLDQ